MLPKIRDVRLEVSIQKYVLGLEISMDYRLLQSCVEMIQSLSNTNRYPIDDCPFVRLSISICTLQTQLLCLKYYELKVEKIGKLN